MSTADGLAPAPPAPAEAEKPNPFQRLAGVLFNPGETFESIARKPDVAVPFAIFIILTILGSILAITRVDWVSAAHEVLEQNPNVTPDRIDAMASSMGKWMKVTAYASPLITIVVLLIVAGVLLVTMRMFGAEGNFKQAFSVTNYAYVPRLIKSAIALVVLMTKSSPSVVELQNPIMSNLGFLFDPKTQLLPYTIASSIDLFNIWTVVLLVIGFAAIGRTSRGKSAAVVVTWWVIVNLFSLIGPAMAALRAH